MEANTVIVEKKYSKIKTISFIIGVLSFSIFIFLLFYPGSGAYSDRISNDNNPFVLNDSFKRVTILAVGDAMTHMPVINSTWDTSCKCYDFSNIFKFLPPIIEQADISFVNYETTNAGPPYSGYPQFSSPDTLAWFLKDVGFNFLVNANNHTNDRNLKGVIRTLDVFDRYQIKHTGVFRNEEERNKNYPLFIKEKGLKLAILNYSYSTNGIPTPSPAIVNTIDTLQIKADLKKALDSIPDAVIVLMHWGVEYQREASPEQKKLADFLFRNGADAIIGSHPHVIQPMEIYQFTYQGKQKNGLVIWSLGNFIANQRRHYANGGILAKFDIAKNVFTGKLIIDRISYIPFWVYKQYNPTKYHILPVSLFENDTTTFIMHDSDKTTFKIFSNETRKHMNRDTVNIKELFLK